MTQEMLRIAWHQTSRGAGLKEPEASFLFVDLCRRYSEPDREYHNLDHIAAMLQTVARFKSTTHDEPALSLAVWFHDAVYDSRRSDNEEQSAAYASSALKEAWAAPCLLPMVERLILATKTHQASADDPGGQLLLDADLAILGADPAEYDQYARAIRAEYAWVPERDYRAGRQKVLRSFLDRSRIYFTNALHDIYEKPARENLRREIETLKAAETP